MNDLGSLEALLALGILHGLSKSIYRGDFGDQDQFLGEPCSQPSFSRVTQPLVSESIGSIRRHGARVSLSLRLMHS